MNINLYEDDFHLGLFKSKVEQILYPDDFDLEKLIIDHSIDEEKADNFIKKFDIEYREAIRHIINSIIHINFKDFKSNLLLIAENIKNKLKDQDYGFLLPYNAENTSETYFTAMVYDNVFKDKKEPKFCGLSRKVKNFIYVDDASYTGSQLIKFLKVLAQNLNYFSGPGGDFPYIDLDIDINEYKLEKENDYLINREGKVFVFQTKDKKKYYKDKLLDLVNDVEKYLDEYPDANFITTPFKPSYLYSEIIKHSYTGIDIYLCIPYISKIAQNLIQKFRTDYPTIKIHLTTPFDYSISSIILKAPEDIKKQVVKLFYTYYDYFFIEHVYPIYFDHKVASIVSTLSIIIGCGLVISPERGDIQYTGPLLKNCSKISESEKLSIEELITIFFANKIKDNRKNDTCSFCPKPVYKLTKEEIKLLR